MAQRSDGQPLLMRGVRKGRENVLDDGAQRKIDDIERTLAGSNRREVQDIINDGQEIIATLADAPAYSRCSSSNVVSKSNPVMPQMPFMGVRSS